MRMDIVTVMKWKGNWGTTLGKERARNEGLSTLRRECDWWLLTVATAALKGWLSSPGHWFSLLAVSSTPSSLLTNVQFSNTAHQSHDYSLCNNTHYLNSKLFAFTPLLEAPASHTLSNVREDGNVWEYGSRYTQVRTSTMWPLWCLHCQVWAHLHAAE